jgi:hypothetical protein
MLSLQKENPVVLCVFRSFVLKKNSNIFSEMFGLELLLVL